MNTKRYAELFRAESRERLAEMNTSLLALERGEGVERVAELVRAVHTVKGMSAAMGYDAVRQLSHALETLLDQLRRGQTTITPEVIENRVEEVTKGFGGDVGIVPRQFLRTLVNLFDVVAENPDADLKLLPTTSNLELSPVEERAADGKRPIEFEREAGDDKGYPVEF